MAKVKYSQINGILSVLGAWLNIKGVSWELLQQACAVTDAVVEANTTYQKLRKKATDDYVLRDESGQPVLQKDDKGNVIEGVGADGQTFNLPDFGENTEKITAEIERIDALMFDCPELSAEIVKENQQTLGITLAHMRAISPLLSTK